MSTAKSKKIEGLISALFSTDQKAVFTALKKIPSDGDARLIIPMLRAHKAWESAPEIQGEIERILKELKSDGAIPELISALEDSDFEQERALIISVFWNAGLFPIEDVAVLVKHGIRGDYMVTLEVLTVVENIDAKLDENMLADSIDEIDDFLEQDQGIAHGELLLELKQVLTGHQEA